MKIAFLGLGIMGAPIATHLLRAGYELTVYNRTAAKAAAWVDRHGGRFAATAALAVAASDIVFTCVTADAALRDLILAQGVLAEMKPGAVLVDHSSASPAIARELESMAAARRIGFLDAPVTGGEIGAIRGELGIMVGGDAALFDRALPVLRAYGKNIRRLGPAGSGHLAKMVNVVIAAGVGQAVAEGITFARKAGLDLAATLEVLAQGSSQSWVLAQKGPKMVSGAYTQGSFSVDLILKDIAGTLAEAQRLSARLPLLELLERGYRQVQQQGGGGWDTASLIHTLL